MSPLDGVEAADIDIAYDARVLDVVSVQPTALLSDFMVTSNIQDDGWIRFGMWAFVPATGGGCAINITFVTEQPGCTLLDITRASMNEGTISSTIDDGSMIVYDPIDQDGDGYTESAGDCSDRFDWIHPGSTEVCNGADDDCDGSYDEEVFCPCASYVHPRDSGFWQRVCRGSSLEDTIQAGYVDYVNDWSTFAAVADAEGLCEVLSPSVQDSCSLAETEFMALLLDVASERLCVEQSINATSTTATDVYAAIVEVDALLVNPARLESDCQAAGDTSVEISRGDAIEEFLGEDLILSMAKQFAAQGNESTLAAVALSWNLADSVAAGRPTVFQVYRSAGIPFAWVLLGETDCHLSFVDADTNFSPGTLLVYQVVGVEP